MNEADVANLLGYFLSSWAIGFVSGYILHSFRRGAGLVR